MTVENGNKLSNADSYVDLDYANDYCSSRSYTDWNTLTDTEKETALIKATDFIDNSFEWYGRKATQEQSLAFPRVKLFSIDGFEITDIPNKLKQAVCVVAVKSISQDLYNDLSENGIVISESVGTIHTTYSGEVTPDKTLFEEVNHLLRGLYVDKSKKKIYSFKIGRSL